MGCQSRRGLLIKTGAGKHLLDENDYEKTCTDCGVIDHVHELDWNLNGDYDALIALDVTLVEAHTGRHVGRILHTKRKGNGLQLFDQSGQFQLRVSSTLARWILKIEQLEPEEKELYTPR